MKQLNKLIAAMLKCPKEKLVSRALSSIWSEVKLSAKVSISFSFCFAHPFFVHRYFVDSFIGYCSEIIEIQRAELNSKLQL